MHCWSTEYHLLTGLNMLDKLEYRFLPFNVWSFLYLHHYIQIIFCSHVVRKMLLFLFPEATTLKLLNVHKDMVHTCSSLFTRTVVLLLRKLLLEVTLPIITLYLQHTYIWSHACAAEQQMLQFHPTFACPCSIRWCLYLSDCFFTSRSLLWVHVTVHVQLHISSLLVYRFSTSNLAIMMICTGLWVNGNDSLASLNGLELNFLFIMYLMHIIQTLL